jgi:hypothetical protein
LTDHRDPREQKYWTRHPHSFFSTDI